MEKLRTSGWLATAQGRALLDRISGLLSVLRLWRWRVRYRHELSMLTEEQMKDTGLDPGVVWRESKKPFWEA